MRHLMNLLAWPEDTGVAGSALVMLAAGLPAYIHTHLKLTRHHQARLQALEGSSPTTRKRVK